MTAPTISVDMRHTKLSAADAALIAGEVTKPSWASRNEGIHERISFDDTLWGFELAGGAFYKTPLRVVYVKPGSRADQACIRKGDTVLRINGIDTSTLTLQEAHDIVLESGIQLKISVTSPDDEEDAYYTYEDPLMDESVIAEQLRKAMEAERIRRALARAQRSCNLPWPWVRRKMIIYRESNCFLVPSKYENKHKEQFPELPHVRYTDDICEINRGTQIETKKSKPKENGHRANSEETEKGEHVTDNEDDNISSVMCVDEKEQNKIIDEILEEDEEEAKNIPSDVDENTHSDDEPHGESNGEVLGPDNEEDSVLSEDGEKIDKTEELIEEEIRSEDEEKLDDEEEEIIEEEVRQDDEEEELIEEEVEHKLENTVDSEIVEENDSSQIKQDINNTKTNDETSNNDPSTLDDEVENVEDEVESTVPTSNFINEDEVVKNDDDNVVDGIVGDGEIDSINER